MVASYHRHDLIFKKPAGTSRGILTTKESWFIKLSDGKKYGIGECGLLRGLSIDDRPEYEEKLAWTCKNIHLGEAALWDALIEFPSIQFGVEMAFKSFESEHPFVLFPSDFTNEKDSILVNGLVWMSDCGNMKTQIEDKIRDGFGCIKLKIGAIDFDEELSLLSFIRQHFSESEMEIRVDANGAFSPIDALHKLNQLNDFQIHSIEQPIAKNNTDTMAELCETAPFPIALDEELIGVFYVEDKIKLLEKIRPQYIILKPSFVGGFRGTQEWITVAEKLSIGWWITSALESNIGLNAIAQWTYLQKNNMPQGLGTGALYTNNFKSPLRVKKGRLWHENEKVWAEIKF